MKIYLVRHAQRDKGIHFDRLLTIGIWQSKAIGPYFKNKKINVVYCSPQKRARETLREILPYLPNVKPKVSKLIRQKSSPEEVGEDVMKSYNMKVDSWEEVELRVKKFLNLLKRKHINDNVLVVSHKEVSRQFVRELIPEYKKIDNEDIKISSASVSYFEFDENFKLKKYKLNQIFFPKEEEDFMKNSFAFAIRLYDKSSRDHGKNVERVNQASRKAALKGEDYLGIATAILQIPLDDKLVSLEEIEKKFGNKIAKRLK